jgi:hypothetical protein
MKFLLFPIFLSTLVIASPVSGEETARGTVVTERLASEILRENRTGLDRNRTIKVYLPPGYDQESGKAYPVVYFLHSLNWSPGQMFEDGNLVKLLEQGFADGAVREFIFVAADCTTPTMGSLYENSPTSGRWLDFITDELVPFVDGKFRTLRHRDSRGLSGDFMGGRGALQLAMTRADLFGSVYALHPVATGTGMLPMTYIDVDWKSVHEARSYAELPESGRSRIFVMICQAFLPNPQRPPFYCDFPMEMENGRPQLDPENSRRLQRGFLLEESLDQAAANLRTMRGIALDWGRYDPTPAHVFANQVFSRKLDDLGIEHEAEEYRGNPWDKLWTPDGRFATRLLPFFNRHLVFAGGK